MLDTALELAAQYGAIGLGIVLVLCSFGFPMAKSLVIVVGGVLAGTDRGNGIFLFLGCSLGLHGGDFSLFLIGRRWGNGFYKAPFLRRMFPEHKLEQARAFVKRHGAASILMARITPFIRSACYLMMGSLRMSRLRFFMVNYAVAVAYTLVFFGIGLVIGNNQDRLVELMRNGNIMFALAVFGVATVLFVLRSRRQTVEATAVTHD